MRTIIIILLFLSAQLSGQYVARGYASQGKALSISDANIPQPSGQVIEVPVDSFTNLRSVNADDWDIEDSINNATVVANVPGTYDLWSGMDGVFEYMAVEDQGGGDRVFKATYPEDQCCIEEQTDRNHDGSPDLGTAFGFRYIINSPTTYRYLYLFWNAYFPTNFVTSMGSASKHMGLYNKYEGPRDSRVAFLELKNPGGDTLSFIYYVWGYTGNGETEIRNLNFAYGPSQLLRYDSIPQNEWVQLGMIIDGGTAGWHAADGKMAIVKNRRVISVQTGIRWHSDADGGTVQFDEVSFDLTAGGDESEYYNMRSTAHIYVDNVYTGYWESLNDGSYFPVVGDIIGLPSGFDYPKSGNPTD